MKDIIVTFLVIVSVCGIVYHEIKQNSKIAWAIEQVDSLNSTDGKIIELQQLTVYKVDSLNTKVNNRLKTKQ